MKHCYYISLITTLLAAGCAQPIPPYAPPRTGPIATIGFINESPQVPITVLFYEDGMACKRMRRLAFYGVGMAESSVQVPAEQPFTFTIDHATTRKYCRQTYTFRPGESTYRITTVAGTDACVLHVDRSNTSGGEPNSWTPVTGLIKREYKAPWSEDGEWCTALPSDTQVPPPK
jgi:hypothetical protein